MPCPATLMALNSAPPIIIFLVDLELILAV
jgi:hypothetical protein